MYAVDMKIKKEGLESAELIKIKVKDEDMRQFLKVATQSFCVGEADHKILKMKK